MSYYSRWARRNERVTRQQSYLFLIAAAIILIAFLVFGIPAILSLAGTVSSLRRTNTATTNKGPAPSSPRLAQDFDATKSASITVRGVADPKVTVEIWQNERSLGITNAKDDGTFSMDVDLTRGVNIFTAVAISDSGQKSEVSDAYIMSYLSQPPKLDIASPKDGDGVKNSPVAIQGATDPAVSISVNDRLAIVDSNGKFSYLLNLNSGDNKVKIVATDRAGNQTTKELTIKLQ